MELPGSASDRRQHERRSLRGVAKVVLARNQTFEVRTVDISVGGMGIVAPANPRAGTAFTIRVTLPIASMSPVSFAARVEVMHSVFASSEEGFRIGLRFVDLDAKSRSDIEAYLG